MLALTALAVAASGRAADAQSETVRVGWPPVEESMLPFYAQEKGFFKAAGVDVALQQLPNGGSVTQAVLGGALDVGVTNSGSLASAHARGVPIYLLACGGLYTPQSPIAHLSVNKTIGVKNAKDLSGKTLAVSTIHDMIQATALLWIDRNGGDSKSVSFTELPPPQQAGAIASKRIDGAVIVEPFFTSAKADVLDLGETYSAVAGGKPFQTLGICANADWANKNPALAKKVAAAIHAAAKWANDPKNREECTTLIAQQTKVPLEVVSSYQRISYAEVNSPTLIQPVIDMMYHYEILPKTFAAAELFVPGVS